MKTATYNRASLEAEAQLKNIVRLAQRARKQTKDGDAAREEIQDDALSVQIRSGWHTPGEEAIDGEYEILLSMGGPAVRIIGELNEYNERVTAHLEYQDWYTPWTEYELTAEERLALLEYTGYYYFGEPKSQLTWGD